MSLKGFHIVFVTISTLLCVFMALWAFLLAKDASFIVHLLAVVGILGSIGMPIYGICFYRKVSNLHI
jgi:hypothetical protein